MERHVFDRNQPQGSMSLLSMRNALRGLFQGDVMPLRPNATQLLDDMEYSTNALAAAVFAGTGCTVTTDGTTKHDGNYALKVVVDGTGNRRCERSQTVILTGYLTIKFWDIVDVTSSAYQFFLKDGSGNESYWDLTSHGTISTWKQQSITLASPDSNSGTPASLGNITGWGFRGLDASKTYRFDNVEVNVGMAIFVEPSVISSYYAPIYIGATHISFDGGSVAISAPSGNPRLSLVTLKSDGTLNVTNGSEAVTPSEPTYPTGEMPIALVYCRVGMTKVVNFEDAAANATQGYIYKDVRPLFLLGMASFLALTDAPSSYSGKGNYRVHVKSDASGLEFILDKLITLTDAPSSYTGKSKKPVRVNSGETGVEFVDIDKITDADGNTKIVVEESANEDKIRMYTAGTRRVLIDSSGMLLQNGTNPVNEFSTDGTFAANSNSKVPTERAIKTYVDGKFTSGYDLGGGTLSNGFLGVNNVALKSLGNNETWTAPAGYYVMGAHRDPDGSFGGLYYAKP